MTIRDRVHALAACLREKHFLHETLKEALYVVTHPSTSMGAAFTSALLGMGQRVLRAATTVATLPTPLNLPPSKLSANTNA